MYMGYRVETIKWQTRAAYGCLVAGQSPVATGLAYGLYRLYALSDTTAPLQLQLPLLALYIRCYTLTLYLALYICIIDIVHDPAYSLSCRPV